MQRFVRFLPVAAILFGAVLGSVAGSAPASADTVTLTGTVTYEGTYSGDTLYVAAIDTVGPEDVILLDLQAYPVGAPPFDQPYSLSFDNGSTAPSVFVASFLDVDGGGVENVGSADVFGWYNGGTGPAQISSATSQSGLDFPLPRAEIHGTITLAEGMTQCRPDVTTGACGVEGFRPQSEVIGSGPYAIIGVYPGTYCVFADGPGPMGQLTACYGDPTCTSPTLVTLTEIEVRNNVDLDFSSLVPVEPSTWGWIKSRYREP
jgi:hypothetical protein